MAVETWRRASRCAAGLMLLALLCLMPQPRLATPPAWASTVRLHYEDAFDDVQATESNEVEIKAAFLMRFPDFVSWPKAPGDTLYIGVAGDDAMLGMLSRLAEQENRAGLSEPYILSVNPVSGATAARRCQILVLGKSALPDSLPALSQAYKMGTLTVGIGNEDRHNTVIHLFREGSRVRFDISLTRAKEAGLMISSRLLNLAREQSIRLVPVTSEPARG